MRLPAIRRPFTIARCAITLALGALAIPSDAAAQSWPARPVTLVVPFPAGGSADIAARSVAAMLGDSLGKQFIVENRGGASGNIGAAAVAKAPPDGYTLLFSTPGPIAQNRLMYKSMPYDPDKDFLPIVLIANSPLIVTAKANSPFKTLQDMVAYAKANPGRLTAGVPGQGTLGHITSELLQTAAGISLTNVPYRGTAPIVTDLLGGQIDLAMDFMTTYVPLVREGRVRALALTGDKRSPDLPDVPSVQETGLARIEATAWYALMAPAGTPAEVVHKVNRAVNDWLRTDKAKAALASMSMQPNGGTPEDLKAFIAAEVAKWGPVIKAANIEF